MAALHFSQISTKPAYQQPLRVIAFGDSLVYGFGDPVRGGWVEQLRLHWMGSQPGHVLYNLGVRGDGIKQVGDRLQAEFQQRGELRNKQPDLMLLSVGVNDSARLGRRDGKNFTEFEQFTLQLAELLDQAQRLCPVMFIGMVPVDEAKMPFLDCLHFNHDDQYRYKEATKLACQIRDIPYLDTFEIWSQHGKSWINNHLCEDGLHPNTQGYEVLFQEIINWHTYPLAEIVQNSFLPISKNANSKINQASF